jgi:polyisoprenoid-binding protein YceI
MKTLFMVTFMAVAAVNLEASRLCVDPAQSKFNINAGTSGLFSAFAHDHLIEAGGIKGCGEIDMSRLEQSSIELTFTTADIKVLDPEHPKDRPKVQQTMETEVLRTKEFPEIHFKSERVRSAKPGSVIIDGSLTIRGRTHQVSIPVSLTEARPGQMKAQGQYAFKQSTFGIKPISLMGGTVRVKDELKIDFDLLLH